MAQWYRILQPMQETWVLYLGQEDPLEKEKATLSSILTWKSHGARSLASDRPWGLKDEDTTWQLNNKVVSTAAVMQILKSKLQVFTKAKGTQLPLHTKPDRSVLDHLVLKSGQPFSHSPAICSSH